MSSLRWTAGLAFALGLFACNSVLGIDAAKTDPGTGAGGSVGGSGAGGGAGGSAAATPCDNYCDTIMAACGGPDSEYTDRATCMVLCQVFDPGAAGDTTSDSLACRDHFATLAEQSPNLHCKHAGPLGTGTCGKSQCDAFCALNVAICAGVAYPTEAECLKACKAFVYKPEAGDIELTSGDTLNCRMYHLEAASNPANPTASATHCPHTQPVTSHCANLCPATTRAGPP